MIIAIDTLLDKEVGAGAPVEAVKFASQALDVHLPDDYQAFLVKYGWARLLRDEFYGVGENVPTHLDLIKNTTSERTAFRPYLPMYLVPVLPDGAGNHFCLDVSRSSAGICPVVFWDHEEGETQGPEDIAVSFSDWIVSHISNQS
jgi:cell wall assembly regulator SMI1